ncbi:MAG: ribosome biogenesis factor YjgA [Gammaproteobacteria bacterium]|nr:MAG: ribosome biogenesis factor YjgA [Gammaproteobacteria bacterium]
MNKSNIIEPTNGNDSLEVSKSQRKREAHELLELAKKLISMPETQLKGLPLDKDLLEEVDFARSIRAHGARKRQLMTVGKLLRKRDAGPLLDAVNNIDVKNRQVTARHHHVEAWRDRLIEGSDQALSELLKQSPQTNAQTLRQLIRNAGKEAKLGKPPTAARKLFKLLREIDEQESLPPLV